jgi:hypothetical protein
MGQNLYSGGNLVVAEILAAEVGLKLAERGAFHNHSAITYAGSAIGSAVMKKDYIDAGAGTLASTAENTAVTPDAYTFTRASVTLAQHRMGRSVSDLLRYLTPTGVVTDVDAFAADAAASYASTLSSLLITAAQSFTGSATPGSGVALTWADIRSAKETLISANAQFTPGDVICVLHPNQFADLEADAASASIGDAVARSSEAQLAMAANAPLSGYRGRYFGIDFFTNTDVPTAGGGADRSGFMACKGGLIWADALIEPSLANEREIIVDGGKLQIDFDRDSSKAMLNVYYQAIMGAAVAQDGAGVTIVSDA